MDSSSETKSRSAIRSLFIRGPAGDLEALLNEAPPGADFAYTALVCHPHPLFGGTMHNKVVYHAMKALSACGFPVLRFNFRGAGLSQGVHDQGRGEVEDARAALRWLASEFGRPIIFCGFSFGAAAGLNAACSTPNIAGMISLGTPVQVEGREYAYEFLRACSIPKLFISGDHDEYSPAAELKRLVELAAPPRKLLLIEGAGHFFEKRLDQVQGAIREWVTALIRQELR